MAITPLLFHRNRVPHGPPAWLARWHLGLLCSGALLLSWGVRAQTVQTVDESGLVPEGAPATSIAIHSPQAIARDGAGSLYIADTENNRIRKVDAATGAITTVAGNGIQGYGGDNGTATAAQLDFPTDVAVDDAGHLYIADTYNHRIRKVDAATGAITTVAGNGTAGSGGDNGAATNAQLSYPSGVAVDSAGHLYIADTYNHRIRMVHAATGTITAVAGSGTTGLGDDSGTSAQSNTPSGAAAEGAAHLDRADQGSRRLRQVAPAAPRPAGSPMARSAAIP